MSEKVYLLILKTGIYASLLSVFLVFKNLLFPFITSKQISFNILIEILFIFWVAFIVKYPKYRPKWSYISFGLVAFLTAIIVSSIFGVDFNLSFWGDIERMLGAFHILHFLAFYFIIITVMQSWTDWKIFLIISTVFATIVSLMGLGGDAKAYSTIGNTAYVSGYLIFNIYFCLLLFFKEKVSGVRWLYLLPLPILYLEFNKADTTGALVGLGFSFIVMFFLYGILAKNKKIKLATLSLFIFLAIFSTLALINKDSDFIRQNSLLAPISGINIQKNTFQTRLISWQAAFKDFHTHPILGTGYGNFAIIFDKYFDASFYDYTRSETYFDRAHNNLIDIASTTGITGLLSYLSIFVAVGYYLIAGFRKKYFGIHEFVLLSSLLTAYFVQNLAVFDSLVTYMGLMMVLAMIYWYYQKGEEKMLDGLEEKANAETRRGTTVQRGTGNLENKEIYSLLGVGVVVFTIMWQYNILPLKMLTTTIAGQRAWAAGNAEKTLSIYKDALGYNTVLDRDSRTSLIRLFASNPSKFNSFPKDKRLEVADYLIDLAQTNVDYNKSDSLNQMMLAQILDTASNVATNNDNKDKATYYSNRALEAIDDSIAASPGRIPIYYQQAQIYLGRGEQDKAIEALKTAYNLNVKYYDSACHLGKTLLYMKKEEEAFGYIDQCIDLGGARLLSPVGLIKSLIGHYQEAGNTKRVIKLYEQLVKVEPNNINNMIELAKLYANAGLTEKAIGMATAISKKDPTDKQYVDDFIKSLK